MFIGIAVISIKSLHFSFSWIKNGLLASKIDSFCKSEFSIGLFWFNVSAPRNNASWGYNQNMEDFSFLWLKISQEYSIWVEILMITATWSTRTVPRLWHVSSLFPWSSIVGFSLIRKTIGNWLISTFWAPLKDWSWTQSIDNSWVTEETKNNSSERTYFTIVISNTKRRLQTGAH